MVGTIIMIYFSLFFKYVKHSTYSERFHLKNIMLKYFSSSLFRKPANPSVTFPEEVLGTFVRRRCASYQLAYQGIVVTFFLEQVIKRRQFSGAGYQNMSKKEILFALVAI